MKTAQRLICLVLASALVLLSPGPSAYAAFVDAPVVSDAPRPVAPQLPALGGELAVPNLNLPTVSIDASAALAPLQAGLTAQAASESVQARSLPLAAVKPLSAATQTAAAKPLTARGALSAGAARLEKAQPAQARSVLDAMFFGSRSRGSDGDAAVAGKDTPERPEDLEPSRPGNDDSAPAHPSEIDRPRHPAPDRGPDSAASFFAMAAVGGAMAVSVAAAAINFIPLVASLILHEMGHAKAASLLGDESPRAAGRLSFSWQGLKTHIDRNGTVIFPLLTMMLGMMPFGWAKPVEPRAGHSRAGMAFIGVAGPLVNLALLGAGLALAHGLVAAGAPAVLLAATKLFIVSNAVLAVFNLIPVFPLDGHWIARAAIPLSWARKWDRFNDNAREPAGDGKSLLRKVLPYAPLVALLLVGNFTGLFPALVMGLIHILPGAAASSGVALAGAALPAMAAAGLMIGQLRAAGPALLNPDKPAAVDSASDKAVDLIVMLGDRVPVKLARDAHLSSVDLTRSAGVTQYAKLQQSMLADLSAAGLSADALASYGATPIATYRRINATTLRVDARRAAALRAALEADGRKVYDNARHKIITPVPNQPESADPALRRPVTMDEVLTITNTDAVHKIAARRWGSPDGKRGLWGRLFGQAPTQTPIAVIDSGAQTEHPLLRQVKKVVNVTSGENKDDIGHGSWVTSMVLNFAKWNRNLTHYKTFVDGSASTDDILKALTAAGNDGNLVISNSWGDDSGDPKGPDSQLVLQLAKEGHVMVFAAGNAGPGANTIGSPAIMYYDAGRDALRVVSVAAAGRDKRIAYFSSRGERSPATKDDPTQPARPDATALGSNVEGAWPQELGPDRVDPAKGPQKAISGTSMSTPDVAGAIALLAMLFGVTTKGERLDAVVRAVIQTLENTGQGRANEGRGFLNVEAAYRLLEKTLAPAPAGFLSRRFGLRSLREVPAPILAEYRRLEDAEWSYQERHRKLRNYDVTYDEDADFLMDEAAQARRPRMAELEARYPQLRGGWRWMLGTLLRGGRP